LPATTEDDVSDELIELTERTELTREEAAARLRQLADQLSRHNEVAFSRNGVRYAIEVPDAVTLKVEVEIGNDESEIEVELTW
jgi:amphi-Trp domain-containing protein